jgi:hypothetical protein
MRDEYKNSIATLMELTPMALTIIFLVWAAISLTMHKKDCTSKNGVYLMLEGMCIDVKQIEMK